MKPKIVCLLAACAAVLLGQTQLPPVVVLEIDTENDVIYRFDTPDVTKLATQSSPTPPALTTRSFMDGSYIADIVAVNRKPAKGLWINRHQGMQFSSVPQPAFAIADVVVGGPNFCHQVFARLDGTIFGTLTDGGVTAHSVLGGSGIFFGARGRHVTTPGRPMRYASTSEDPSRRRDFGGGTYHAVYYIYPAFRPEVEETPQGPVILHTQDFSLVTVGKPAQVGEILTVRAKGLGSTTPDLLPPGARLFPVDPPDRVLAPVYVLVNGKEAEVINAIGWPNTYDFYRVDFRVPATPAGMAAIQLVLTWIPGPEVKIPVQ